MIITGNVQVSQSHLTLGRDVTLAGDKMRLEGFTKWAESIKSAPVSTAPLAIMQLSHAGRQSPRIIGGRYPWIPPVAPSSNPMTPREGLLSRFVFSLLFQTPRAASTQDIDSIVEAFLHAAVIACRAGFDGIQLHASHGYLLSQFLSIKNNHRSDDYGPPNELRLLSRIVQAIRAEASIPSTFVVGIKLNAGDYASDQLDETRALAHVRSIAQWKNVDFLEISGGDYESPDFLRKDNPRQAFFASFSRKALQCVSGTGSNGPKIMLTGSIRSAGVIHDCLSNKHADLIGIGRPAILHPDLPQKLIQLGEFPPTPSVPALPRWVSTLVQIKLVGAGLDTAVWVRAMKRMARSDRRRLEGNAIDAFLHLFLNIHSTTPLFITLILAIILAARTCYYMIH